MKKVSLFICSLLLFGMSGIAQEAFYGEWHMQELAYETLKEKEILTNEMLKSEGTVWIMRFSKEGKFFQASNYNRESRMDEMEGTWKTEPNELLTIFLVIDGKKMPLQFFYEFKGDKMILERYDQLRTQKMVVVFKK